MFIPWLQFSAALAPPTPPPAPAIVFSAGFSSDMVLQRGTGGAAVYGLVAHGDGAAAAPPSVTVRVGQGGGGGGGAAYTVVAALLPAPTTGIAPFGTAANASAWRALLRPAEAGGPALAITASCTGCGGGGGGGGGTTGTTATLERVAYGDVYFCSGQSNMALPLHYTYSGAPLTEAIGRGQYANLRLVRYGGMSVSADFQAHAPRYATTVGAADTRWWNAARSRRRAGTWS